MKNPVIFFEGFAEIDLHKSRKPKGAAMEYTR